MSRYRHETWVAVVRAGGGEPARSVVGHWATLRRTVAITSSIVTGAAPSGLSGSPASRSVTSATAAYGTAGLGGQCCLRRTGHVHDVPAHGRVPARFGAGREPRTVDHDHRPAVVHGRAVELVDRRSAARARTRESYGSANGWWCTGPSEPGSPSPDPTSWNVPGATVRAIDELVERRRSRRRRGAAGASRPSTGRRSIRPRARRAPTRSPGTGRGARRTRARARAVRRRQLGARRAFPTRIGAAGRPNGVSISTSSASRTKS